MMVSTDKATLQQVITAYETVLSPAASSDARKAAERVRLVKIKAISFIFLVLRRSQE